METNIFNEEITKEAVLKFLYSGASFSEGSMEIRTLYTELQSLEKVLRDSVDLLIDTGKLDPSFKDLEIHIQIEKGSVKETVKIIFSKSTASQLVVAVIAGMLSSTYTHFLDGTENVPDPEYAQEINFINDNQAFRENLTKVISPLEDESDFILIQDNSGTINITINKVQKDTITSNLQNLSEEEDPLAKNGEFNESLTGVIRKLDLDASGNNYFGFTVDSGPAKVPTSIKGEFHLNDVRGILDVHISVNAQVKYKNGEIKHIHILEYQVIGDETNEIPFE